MRLVAGFAASAFLALIACDQNGSIHRSIDPAPMPPNAAATPKSGTATKTPESDILRTVAMYLEFESQAIRLRQAKHEGAERQGLEAPRGNRGAVYSPVQPARETTKKFSRTFDTTKDCNDVLTAKVSAVRGSLVAELVDAAQAARAGVPDGSLDDDHKAYLKLIEQAQLFEGVFSAEQALIHDEVIAELEAFVLATPRSPIRPSAERTLGVLKTITAGPCVRG